MNVMAAVNRAATTARRVDRSESPVRDDRTESADRDETRPVSKAEFSALLALLAGAGPRVRSDLVRQLPEEGVTLVDKLLEGAASDDALATDVVGPSPDEAGEALRYGLLKLMPADGSTDNVIDLASYKARDTAGDVPGAAGLAGLARAASRLDARGSANERALEALARVANQRGATLDQLLAVGDKKGADARAAIDAILAQAGTPAGARLAARRIMNETTANVLGAEGFAPAAGSNANAAALAAATAASAADVSTPVKDLDAVAPELRTKLERVIDRMKQEYGHDVTVVETARSQERQDWLYEQGRTRAGDVVTWTRDSAHTRGDAVDVIIDGSWNNAAGFARLQRIAREEGLRTLGVKDPGHLELATSSTARGIAGDVLAARSNAADNTSGNAAAAGMARVASVAGVAGVAQVADGSMSRSMNVSSLGNAAMSYSVQQGAAQAGDGQRAGQGDAHARNGQDNGKSATAGSNGKALGHSHDDTPAFGAMHGNGMGTAHITGTERAAQVAAGTGSDQAQRVSDIQQMRDDAPALPLSRMTLNVEGANGTQERITVDVRGNTVNTHITTDAATADRIRMRSADLQDALGRHGLEGDSVRISASARAEGAESARAIAGERDALKLGATQQSATQDQSHSSSQRDRTPQREQTDPEARREQAAKAREDRQQQQQGRQRRPNLFTGNE
jgi:peptidoglycan L-alanyl-D-glutamate endopeptidase CwlK